MTASSRDQLHQALAELHTLFPDWRFGQLMANLATAAGATDPEKTWDIEDEQLLAAVRRLLDRNRASGTVLS